MFYVVEVQCVGANLVGVPLPEAGYTDSRLRHGVMTQDGMDGENVVHVWWWWWLRNWMVEI